MKFMTMRLRRRLQFFDKSKQVARKAMIEACDHIDILHRMTICDDRLV